MKALKTDPRANSINYNYIRSTRPASVISIDGSEAKSRRQRNE